MFHPVGSQPPSVYWRRRFLALAALVVLLLLLVLTVHAATSGASGTPQAGGAGPTGHGGAAAPTSSHPAPRPTSRVPHTHAAPTRGASQTGTGRRGGHTSHRSALSDSAHRAPARSSSAPPPPPQCRPADLQVKAYVAQTVYHVGDKPEVDLEVTDIGAGPCVQDLADPQVVLQVYNGESRVWGSHDCMVKPGTDDRVLAVGKPVFVGVTWSGYTSTPGCPAGSRQRVGAGTYTLYASLSGHEGAATQFSIV